MVELWREYEGGESEAAQVVHGIDALECLDQAHVYRERWRLGSDLKEFDGLGDKIETPQLKAWHSHLKREEEALLSREELPIEVIFVLGTTQTVESVEMGWPS